MTVRRSVEVEYWVVDEEGELTDSDGLLDAAPGVEREFVVPMVEVKTSPCETQAELRRELFGRLDRVLTRAETLGKRLVPLATPLDASHVAEVPDQRTEIQNRVVGAAFAYVRHCAGTHVHVEQQPGDVVDQLNTLVALDPALALLNSAPYFRGEYLAPGARSKLYRWMAYDDLHHQGELWPYVDDRSEWTRRLERRYEEFVAAATDAGVDRQAVEAHFDPESAVWTPVQLRETFGTVEWRSPDTAFPEQVLGVAETVAETCARAAEAEVVVDGSTGAVGEDRVVLPEFDALVGHVEAAVEEGLASRSLRRHLDGMGFDVDAYDPHAAAMAGGETVDRTRARRLRLRAAARLEREVERALEGATPE